MEIPELGPGEIRMRLHASGINPTDCKRPSAEGEKDWNYAYHFPNFPRIIPNNDGAGKVDKIGESVSGYYREKRVWVYNARYRGAFGTAAEYVVLPAHLVVACPKQFLFRRVLALVFAP